jgi:putative phage-type endonuclease
MQQQTPEWLEVKKLHFTASHASTILTCDKGLNTLIEEMLAEYYSSGSYEEYSNRYKNAQINRGNEYEDRARKIYELETGNTVEQVGFVELNDNVGASPDGLVNDDGLIEIKNHNDVVFLRLVETGKIDKKYYNQMQYQMYVTGRKWCDYFGFNPNYSPCYFKKRIYPDQEVFNRLDTVLPVAIQRLNARKNVLDRILSVA